MQSTQSIGLAAQAISSHLPNVSRKATHRAAHPLKWQYGTVGL